MPRNVENPQIDRRTKKTMEETKSLGNFVNKSVDELKPYSNQSFEDKADLVQ